MGQRISLHKRPQAVAEKHTSRSHGRKKRVRFDPPAVIAPESNSALVPGPPDSTSLRIVCIADFSPLSANFPYTGTTALQVRLNIAYLRKELIRWDRSIAYLCDSITETRQLRPHKGLLDQLGDVVQDENAVRIGVALCRSVIPLVPWSGTVVRDSLEFADLMVAVNQSALVLQEVLAAALAESSNRREKRELRAAIDDRRMLIKKVQHFVQTMRKMIEEDSRDAAQHSNVQQQFNAPT